MKRQAAEKAIANRERPPDGVPVVCVCRAFWFVREADVGQPCWGCGRRLERLHQPTHTHLQESA